jgi:hypothetical protein
MRIGYARVSTQDQNLNLQKDALKRAGGEKVIVDMASGKSEARAGWRSCTSLGAKATWLWCGGWIGSGARCGISLM